jgi:quercetin dioxygenase-like cupin family protein
MSGPTEAPTAEVAAPVPRFRIFRATDARDLDEQHMPAENITAVDQAGMAQAGAVGAYEGATAKLLFADPASGLSIGYVWFKANFVLPRHSHDADCAYYVISGEAHLGTEVLRAGDGFFVPAGHNYQYSAGPEGVEVLECRNTTRFNIRLSGNGEAAWRRFADVALANREHWAEQPTPPAVARMGG